MDWTVSYWFLAGTGSRCPSLLKFHLPLISANTPLILSAFIQPKLLSYMGIYFLESCHKTGMRIWKCTFNRVHVQFTSAPLMLCLCSAPSQNDLKIEEESRARTASNKVIMEEFIMVLSQRENKAAEVCVAHKER